MSAFEAGAAQPVSVDTTGGKRQAGAAIPVYVASGGPRIAGPARRVVVVADGPIEGRAAVPVYEAVSGGVLLDGPAVPVFVVQGSLGAQQTYSQKIAALYPSDQIGYWKLNELSGTNANDSSVQNNDGTYSAAGITYGEPGIGDGLTSVKFSGADTYIQLGTAAFGADWNGNKGSAIAWAKADSAARWTDGLTAWWVHIRATDDANYNVAFGKSGSNNLQWRRRSGGAIQQVNKTVSAPTDWLFMAMTWDLAVPEIRAYDQTGLVGTAAGGFTTWAPGTHVPDSSNITLLFAGSLTLQEWFGWGAHAAVWANRVLSAAEIAALAVVP